MVKIQNFVFCWNDFVKSSLELEKNLQEFGNTIVINSNTSHTFNHWITLNDGFFSEQWNCLLNNIDKDADFILHIQSDASISNYNLLFERFFEAESKYNIGIFSPNVDYTWHEYHIQKLKKIEDFIYEVPNTDCTCWFINTKLINKNTPLYNVEKNKYGYGADWYYSAKARLNNKLVLRDYYMTVKHPCFKGYDQNKASEGFEKWKSEQSENIKQEIDIILKEVSVKNINF